MSEDPPWELLPGDPLGFFGLAPGAAPEELRRRYTALLRRFRPERHPQEFQRLRAAYEAAEARLRASPPARPVSPSSELSAAEPACAMSASESAPHFAAPLELLQAVLRADARHADALESEARDERFVRGLLAALAAHPESFELSAVLGAFLALPRVRRAPLRWLQVLEALAHEELYVEHALPLWLLWMRSVPFEQFRADYEPQRRRCARGGLELHHLRLRLLRAAVFVADSAWLAREYEEVSAVPLPRERALFDVEMELIEALLEHRAEREHFLVGSPLRARIDDTLAVIADAELEEAGPAMLALLEELALAGPEVLRAFPEEGGPGLPALRAFELFLRSQSSVLPTRWKSDPRLEETRAIALLRRLENAALSDKSVACGAVFSLSGLIFGSLGLVLLVLFPLAALRDGTVLAPRLLLTGVLLLAGLVEALRRALPEVCGRIARRRYEQLWRPLCYTLLREMNLSLEAVLRRAAAPQSRGGVLHLARIWRERAELDRGMAFAELARRLG
jgi:hypothetical protein